jgi:hypothetical protein
MTNNQTHKSFNKCEEVLRNILEGLIKNPSLDCDSLLLSNLFVE